MRFSVTHLVASVPYKILSDNEDRGIFMVLIRASRLTFYIPLLSGLLGAPLGAGSSYVIYGSPLPLWASFNHLLPGSGVCFFRYLPWSKSCGCLLEGTERPAEVA